MNPGERPPRLSEKRLTLVLGKGGVGKTTIAAAWALALSRRGKRVLLAQVNAKERLSAFLAVEPITDELREVRPNLFAVNMTPESALHQYGLMILRFERIYKLVFENKMAKAFLRAVPGLDEWVMLGKTWYHFEERLDDETPRYDQIILDCPATGHGILFLRAPRAVIEAVPSGPLVDYAHKMRAMLEDPKTTAPIYVTLPEDMPVNETIELRDQSERVVKLPKGEVAINALHPRIVDGPTAQAFAALEGAPESKSPELAPFIEAAKRRMTRRQLQEGYVARLAAALPDLPQVALPFLAARSFGFKEIERLADALERTWIDRVPSRGAR